MNGRKNITPSEPRSMTQPLHVLSSLPPSPVNSSMPPLNPSPSSYRRNSLTSLTQPSAVFSSMPRSAVYSSSPPSAVFSSLPPSAVHSSFPPLSHSPSSYRRNSSRSMSLSPSLFRDSPSAHVENRDSSIWVNENSSSLPPSSLKRRAGEDIDPLTRHYRSVSMDSCFNDMLKLPPGASYVSSTSSVGGDEEYTADELKMIQESSDPIEFKKILAKRKAAKRSKLRKSADLTQWEDRVKLLTNMTSSMDKRITDLKQNNEFIIIKQNEIKIRLESLEEQHEQLRDETERQDGTTTLIEQGSVEANRLKEVIALNEQLRIKIQRLKIATGEVIQNHNQFDGSNMHQMDPNMFQHLTINGMNHQPQTNPNVQGQI